MILKQLSVFLENRSGQLAAFVRLMAEQKVDLKALSIAESRDYGILRVVVDDPEGVAALLKKEGWSCKLSEVLAVVVPDEPGSLTRIFSTLAENDISVSYTYAFYTGVTGQARVVLRVADNEKTAAVLKAARVIE